MNEANMHLFHTFAFIFNVGIKETLETLNRSIEEKFVVCQDIYTNIYKPMLSKTAEKSLNRSLQKQKEKTSKSLFKTQSVKL